MRAMPAPNVAARPTIRAGPAGPLFKMDQQPESPRLNTPTSGRMRFRGAPAPAWLRDSKPAGTKIQGAVLTVEPTEAGIVLGGIAAAPAAVGTSGLGSPTTVVGVTGPLKARAERQRRKVPAAPPIQADGSSIPSMRGGGWTPRWEALQGPLGSPGGKPGEFREYDVVASRLVKQGLSNEGLELTVDPETESASAGKVAATAIRTPRVSQIASERVYYKFSPRRARFAETAMGIAAGPR